MGEPNIPRAEHLKCNVRFGSARWLVEQHPCSARPCSALFGSARPCSARRAHSDWKEEWQKQEIDSERQISKNEISRVSRRRPLERFGLPVTLETASLIDKHVSQLYSKARSLKEAYRITRDEFKEIRSR